MNRPFFFPLVACSLLIFVGLVFFFTPLSHALQWSSAKFEDVATSSAIDPKSQTPIEIQSTFPPATPDIYCTCRAVFVPDGTEIRAEWIYVRGEASGMENHVLETVQDVLDEDAHISFHLPAPPAGWLRGDYRVDLYVFDKKKASTTFTVEGPDAVPTITAATMCHALDPYRMTPVKPTDIFITTDPEMCCSVRLDFAPQPVQIEFVWRYTGGDQPDSPQPQEFSRITLEAKGGRHLGSNLPANEGQQLVPGNYVVDVLIDGTQAATVPFRVVTAQEAATMPDEESAMSEGGVTEGIAGDPPPIGVAEAAVGGVLFVIYMIFIAFFIICQGVLFAKAHLPWWGCLIPIYNIYLFLKLAEKPGWWLFLALIPFVNFVFLIMLWFIQITIAKNFGKGAGFGLGLMFIPIIFYPILAFGSARYQPANSQATEVA